VARNAFFPQKTKKRRKGTKNKPTFKGSDGRYTLNLKGIEVWTPMKIKGGQKAGGGYGGIATLGSVGPNTGGRNGGIHRY